jgi:ATP-binding cassette subfamily B multidrug efflux pump
MILTLVGTLLELYLLAIIGSTRAGKTSLVQLIPRFYAVEAGAILINGIDVRQMSQRSLRQKIGYVPQKAFLFSGSIAGNLRFGKEDATEEEMVEALRTAQALDFVKEKEDGIHTRIEQGGANLSGGQKQCISIARALIRKPEIYVFDDGRMAGIGTHEELLEKNSIYREIVASQQAKEESA